MIIEMLGYKIADYRKIKRRNCFKKKYYKYCWVDSADFAQLKRENKENEDGKDNNL